MPLPIAQAIGMGVSAIGGAAAGAAAGENERRAREAYEQSVADYEAIGIPTIEAQRIVLEEYQNQGILTPELEASIKQGDTGLTDISLDPAYKSAQIKALTQLGDLGESGGVMLSDRAASEDALENVRGEDRGRREAINQRAQEMGGYGSGAFLAMQMQNAQDSAENTYEIGLSESARQEQRALDAILQGGEMAGDLRGQEYGEKAREKEAQDAIDRWNTQNSQSVQQRNVANQNWGQEYNLNRSQDISDRNVDTRNDQETYNKGLYQTRFGNEMDVTRGKADARSRVGAYEAGEAGRKRNAGAEFGAGAIGAGTAYDQYRNNTEERQKDRDLIKDVYGTKGPTGGSSRTAVSMGPTGPGGTDRYKDYQEDPNKRLQRGGYA